MSLGRETERTYGLRRQDSLTGVWTKEFRISSCESLRGNHSEPPCIVCKVITSKRELGAGKRTKHIGATVMEPDSYVLFFF